MTPEEARERLEWYATFSDGMDRVLASHRLLARLLDPIEMLEIWEEQGKVEEGVEVPYGVEWRRNAPSEEEWQHATAGMERVYRRVS
jgi:hypothetical protein